MKNITILIITIFIVNLFTGCPKTTPNKKVVETIVNTFTTEFKKTKSIMTVMSEAMIMSKQLTVTLVAIQHRAWINRHTPLMRGELEMI